MGFNHFFSRVFPSFMGGKLIEGHIKDALQKKEKTGKSFRECLEESVNETLDINQTKEVDPVDNEIEEEKDKRPISS